MNSVEDALIKPDDSDYLVIDWKQTGLPDSLRKYITLVQPIVSTTH